MVTGDNAALTVPKSKTVTVAQPFNGNITGSNSGTTYTFNGIINNRVIGNVTVPSDNFKYNLVTSGMPGNVSFDISCDVSDITTLT
jgi:hypothetical protein